MKKFNDLNEKLKDYVIGGIGYYADKLKQLKKDIVDKNIEDIEHIDNILFCIMEDLGNIHCYLEEEIK